jgi:hypothetical protein
MLSLLLILIIAGIGIFGIVLAIDFCEHLRKYRPKQWESVTYERVFGISRDDLPVNPIRPLKFIIAVFTSEDGPDFSTSAYKMKLKLIIISFVALFLVLIFIS